VLGVWDVDAVVLGGGEENFQDMLGQSCRSHAALLATMAPEGNLDVRFLSCYGIPHHRKNIDKHLLDERPGDGGAGSLAKYRGLAI